MIDRALVKETLGKYRICRDVCEDLKHRLARLCDGSPMSVTASEIERQMMARRHEAERTMQAVMHIIGILPEGDQRRVLELRYLDLMPWERIADRMCYDMTTCWRKHNAAIDTLTAALQARYEGDEEAPGIFPGD